MYLCLLVELAVNVHKEEKNGVRFFSIDWFIEMEVDLSQLMFHNFLLLCIKLKSNFIFFSKLINIKSYV